MTRKPRKRATKYTSETFAAVLGAVLHGRSSSEHDERAREFSHADAHEWVLEWIDWIGDVARSQVQQSHTAAERAKRLVRARAELGDGADLRRERASLDAGLAEARLRAKLTPSTLLRTRVLELVFALGTDPDTTPSARDATIVANLTALPAKQRRAALARLATGKKMKLIEGERTANRVRRQWLGDLSDRRRVRRRVPAKVRHVAA